MPPSRHRHASPPTRALPLPLLAGAAAVLLLSTAPVASAADDAPLPQLVPTSGDTPASADAAFAAVCNGTLVAWGAQLRGGDADAAALAAAAVASDAASLSATAGAFAALGTDGSVAVWGSAAHGGDAATVYSNLTGVRSVHATAGAFAAVNEAGGVAAWGDANRGGDAATVAALLVDVRAVYSTRVTFAAAVGNDSRVVTWGQADTGAGGGGNASEILLGSPGTATVVTTQGAFAARTADGSVVVWGDAAYGGDAAAVQPELQQAELVTATSAAFAALSTVQDNQTAGSFVAWGSAAHGGDATTVAELLQLEGVVRMEGTDSAFAAVTKAGGVVAWGDNARGGDHTGASRPLEAVTRLYSTAGAFAAVTEQGAVSVWGEQGSGGDDSAVRSDLASGVQSVAGTDGAFAALKSDGSVVAWGSPDHGGDASTVADLLAGGVATLHATSSAFAAVRENGSVVAWGPATGGGDAVAAADFFAACAEPATPAPTDTPATEAPTPETGYVFCLDLQADECAEKAQWCRVPASGQGCEFRDDCSAHGDVRDCRYTPQCWWDAKLQVCSVDDLCFRIGRQPHCELAGCSWVWNANRCTSRHSACGGYDKNACAAATGRCLYDDAGAACRPVAGCAGLGEAACAAEPRCAYAAGACLANVQSCAVFRGDAYCRVPVTQTEVVHVPCEGIRSEYAVNVLLGAAVSDEQLALAMPKDVWRGAKDEASGEPACGSLDDQRTRCLPCAAGYVLNPAARVQCFKNHVLGFIGQLCVRPGEACAMRPAEQCYAPACHVEPKDVCSDAVPPGCTGLSAFECLAKGRVCDRDTTGACMDAPCAAGVPKTACEGAQYPAGGSGGRVCAWEKDSAACAAAAVEAAQCAALPDGLCLGALTPCGWEAGRCVACADAGTRDACKAAGLIGCDWSAAEQCEPVRKSCGALKTSEVCLRDGQGCAWTAEAGCFDPEKKCTDHASESACSLDGPGSALNLGCAWVGKRCVPAKVVCETLTRNACAFNTRCVWDKTGDTCAQTDVCITAEDEPVCVALGCAWVANLKLCSTLQSGCAGRKEDECTGHCVFDKQHNICATVAGCAGATQVGCVARRGCEWSADSSSCVAQGSGATCHVLNLGAATTACHVNGVWAPCARISSTYKAGSPLRLEQGLRDGTSILAAHTGRVLTHDLKQLCPEDAGCHFCEPGSVMNPNAAVFCGEAGGGVLRIRGELCVSPDSCALRVAATCRDECEWNMQTAECRPERCHGLEEAACSSNGDCAWLSYDGTTYKFCAAAPIRWHCQNTETPEECDGRYHCAYDAAKAECRGVDAVALCTGKPFEDCLENGGMCEWDTASLACVPFNCKLVGREKECAHRHCEWNASPGLCAFKAECESQGLVRCSSDASLKCGMVYQGEKPAVCVSCGGYGSADACGRLLGCLWNPLQSTCVHVTCDGRPNDASCGFVNGCFWDAASGECVEAAHAPPCAAREQCTGLECVSGKAPATCTEAPVDCSEQNQASCGRHMSCWWDMRGGACQAHAPCGYIREAKACGAAACTWIASLEKCVAFTIDCAEKAAAGGENATECAGAFCGYVLDASSKEEECQVHVGCNGLSEASCDTASWNCTYSTKESKCVTDAQPMCDSLDLSGNACEVDGADGPCVGVSKAWGGGLIRARSALRDGSLMLQADPGYSWYAVSNQTVCLPGAACEVCAGGLVLNPFAVVRCVEGVPASIVGVLCIPPERVCRSEVEVCLGQQHPSPPTPTFDSCTAPDEEGCVEARVPWSTHQLCEFDPSASAGCRLASLCTATNAYAQCFFFDGAQVVPGFCSPEDGQCVAGPPEGDCLSDVATKSCGISDGAFRNRCFDPDRTANGAFECLCSVDETWEHATRKCVANPNFCPLAASRSVCEAQHKVCRVLQGGATECLERMCAPPADSFCDGHDRAGCVPALTPDPNNCAAFPCAQFNCTSNCGVEDKEECMLNGMTEGKHLRCDMGIVGATCVAIECSTPKCSQPPADCYYIPDPRVDPLTSCPVLPCGKLYCPTKCLPRSEAACTLKKMRCSKGEDGVDRCTAYQCPVPDCNPPPGCAYQWSADADPAKDRNGCPYAPCGTLLCGRSICSDGTNCCPPSGPCKICVGDQCVPRPNPFAAAACLPVAGCTFRGARAAGSPTPCGVEECAPAQMCNVIRCATGRCEVAYDAGGNPFPNCLPVTKTCQGCASRSCTWDDEGVVACVPVPACATTVCPAGMSCYDGADGTEAARCFPRDVAACGGCLDDPGAVCELVRGAQAEDSALACVKRHPAGARCEKDGCACAGAPCQGLEQCVQSGFATSSEVSTKLVTVGCAVVSDAAADTRDVDPCGSVLCGAGRECVHHPARAAASCRPVPVERCRGTVCTPPALCNERTGVCENANCVPACPLDEQCMFVSGASACVRNKCPTEDEWWLAGTCLTDTDCDDDVFSVCPAPTSTLLEAYVSAHCTCNPVTGKAARCVREPHPTRRRCIRARWNCNVADSKSWSPAELLWCCQNRQIGCCLNDERKKGCANDYQCTTPDDPTTWSADKIHGCCQKTQLRGCPIQATPPLPAPRSRAASVLLLLTEYDCTTEEEFTYAKKVHCCGQKKIACPVPAQDCSSTTLTAEEKVRCCTSEGKHCVAPPNLYDCKSAGLWSPLQAKYCCRVHGLGCTGEKSPHDCGGESTGTDWDYYCCAKASRGCKPNDAPTGPYECYDGMYRVETLPVLKLSVPERVAEWCCSFRGLGCKQRDYCVVQFEISSDDAVREACCSSTGLGCKYTCSEGVQWTADEEAYCCRTGGSQCNAQDLSEAVAAQEALLKTLPHAVVEAKIRANWNEIAQKPKLFARKAAYTLRFLLNATSSGAFGEGNATVQITEVGPLTASGEHPANDSALHAQAIGTPWAWSKEQDSSPTGLPNAAEHVSLPSLDRAAHALQVVTPDMIDVYVRIVILGDTFADAKEHSQVLVNAGVQLFALGLDGLGFVAPMRSPASVISDGGETTAAPDTAAPNTTAPEPQKTPAPPVLIQPKSSGTAWWVYVVIGLVGVCVLGGVVAVCSHTVFKRSKDDDSSDEGEDYGGSVPVGFGETQSPQSAMYGGPTSAGGLNPIEANLQMQPMQQIPSPTSPDSAV